MASANQKERFVCPPQSSALFWKIWPAHLNKISDDKSSPNYQRDRNIASALNQMWLDLPKTNTGWIERRFQLLRETGGWSVDAALVNQEGRHIEGKKWSTFEAYKGGNNLPPKFDDILEMIANGFDMVFPITPVNDTVFVWFSEDKGKIVPVMTQVLGKEPQVEEYPINPRVAPKMPDMVQMTRIPREIVGTDRLADEGVVLGKIGFWENLAKHLSPEKYLPRVVFARSKALDTKHYASPLSEAQVIAKGGLTMGEKYGVGMVRPEPDLLQADFIAAALIASRKELEKPVALSFTAYRPWFGEFPHHG